MHETIGTNGTGEAMHESVATSEADRLRAEVSALTARYDQVRASHADAKARQREHEARADSLVAAQKRANEKHKREREQREIDKAAARIEADRAQADVARANDEMAEVRRLLRKREQQLAIELSDRTPRARKS